MGLTRDVPVHYLRPNHTEWTPPAFVALDTETMPAGEGLQVLRLWAACRLLRPDGRTNPQSRMDGWGTTTASLAEQMEAWTKGADTLWIYCHNLGFDLAVSRLPTELCARGWEVKDFAIDGRAPWMRLGKGRKRITLSDSWSWVPTALSVIGGAVRIPKPALPDDGDSQEAWLARCRGDVDILAAMMSQLMDWWAETGRGRWSVTGAAAGWNAYRHTPTPYKIVIDPNPEGVAHERSAIYGGKRFVGRVGRLTPGQYAEIDFSRAYTVAAATLPLPIRRMRRFDTLSTSDPLLSNPRWGVIAEVTIQTDRPRFPKRAGGRIWYPVGRFRTVLAGPELSYAAEVGALIAIHSGYSYQCEPHMRSWAEWCLDVAGDHQAVAPEVVRMAAKQWGRSVVGKWAQRGYGRVALGPAPTHGWGYETAWLANTHVRGSLVDLGGRRFMCFPDGDGENAFPAILAFIEGFVRVGLNRVIDAIGGEAFVQCDTDGLLCSVADLMRRARQTDTRQAITTDGIDFLTVIMEKISAVTAPLTLRVKRTYSRVEIIGPQHVVVDGTRHFSGIPGSGDELDDGRIGAWTWPKLGQQMAMGTDAGYTRVYNRYRVPRALAAGWITTEGRVLPMEWVTLPDGTQRPLRWTETRWAAVGEELATTQTPDVLTVVSAGLEV